MDSTDGVRGNMAAEQPGDKGPSRQAGKDGFNIDVQQYMNMNHFEQLMVMFQSHENEDGTSGFDIDKFREVFGKVVGGNLTYDQMTMLFMKIDANSDGTVDWDEFSNYMMSGALDAGEGVVIFDERIKKFFNSPHKDIIKRLDYIVKERKYISVSREGGVCLWAQNLKLQRVVYARDLGRMSWLSDAIFIQEHNRLVTVTDDRQLCVYDVLSIKPRLVVALTQLENNPLCLAYGGQHDDERDFLLFGDDGGYINVLIFNRKFFTDNEGNEELTVAKLSKRDSLKKYNATFYRRKTHNDWVVKVQYYQEINAFVSCAPESVKSLVVGDLERKTIRYVPVSKGIRCFEFCRRPSFLVTGGRDKIIRLWNPYVLSKPAGSLHGHNMAILAISVNHEEGHIISLSEDRVIKVWNARTLNCLQTLTEKLPQRPDELVSVMFFDTMNRQLLVGSDKVVTWPLYKTYRHTVSRSHDSGVVAAMFNENFHQVVSGAADGTVCIWDLASGVRTFSFHNAHGKQEITAMCFDRSGRRLVTGSRDGVVKMWNFNNGQILRKMLKDNVSETTDVLYVEMGSNRYIVAVGWDRKITIFLDDPTHFEARPVRIMNGSGSGAHKGHQDDISSVAFCPPSMLATSSVDGIIVIWSLESGYIKMTLNEPFLDLRSKEEKAIEKILFLQPLERKTKKSRPLASCHADGCLRFWDTFEGVLLYELNCQVTKDEGLGTMATSFDGSVLVVGGSKGHIRIFEVNMNALATQNYDMFLVMKKSWRAHIQSISSVNYANIHNVLLTASKDGTIRVWTTEGAHIGVFGQDDMWTLGETITYKELPEDVKQAYRIEEQRNQLLSKHQEMLKKNVIDTWRGISMPATGGTEDDQPSPGYTMANIKELRTRAIQAQVVKKWTEQYKRRKSAVDWTLNSELLASASSDKPQFFSLNPTREHHQPRSFSNVKYDAVYHMLAYYPLSEVPAQPGPGARSRNAHRIESVKPHTAPLTNMRKERMATQSSGKF
ncbi:WD40-repeat-containing domain protein [Phlyctochytrium arcticum]|nr:WD40-repeat-containing domain protein [Phlyctochytrium arcticum]